MLHSARWRDAHISCYLAGAAPLTLSNLPILTDLSCFLIAQRRDVNRLVPRATIDLSNIPKLQHLSLNGHIRIPMIPKGAILSYLTTLRLESYFPILHNPEGPILLPGFPNGSDCLNILRNAPLLQEIQISMGGEDDAAAALQEAIPFSLDHLTYLNISYNETRNSSGTSLSRMLRNINAPFLELLMFEILSFENANIAQQQDVFLELANFIVRSNMPLSSLTLRLLPDFQTELVHNVLQQLPNLLHLHVQSTFSPEFLLALARTVPSSTEFALCPQLQTIYFEGYERTGYRHPTENRARNKTLLSMLDVISRRWNVPSSDRSLRTAVISSSPAHPEKMEDWDEVKRLTTEGLRFRLAPRT